MANDDYWAVMEDFEFYMDDDIFEFIIEGGEFEGFTEKEIEEIVDPFSPHEEESEEESDKPEWWEEPFEDI